jgi:tetrahydromethanopterin S-methyltransferase subunit G
MNEETLKVVVSDVMSDFYNEVIKNQFDNIEKRFNNIEKRFDNIDLQLTDLRLTTTTLVKIVDYARLEAKVNELESRLKKLES